LLQQTTKPTKKKQARKQNLEKEKNLQKKFRSFEFNSSLHFLFMSTFEFCAFCRQNHSQGKKHVYFPAHSKAVSQALDREKTKVKDYRFFLSLDASSPILRAQAREGQAENYFCLFCDKSVVQLLPGKPFR
jgi:hypothetical protein